MLTITVRSSNDTTRTIALENINREGNAATWRDLCAIDAVTGFFGAEPAEIAEAIEQINGTAVPGSFRQVILNAAAEDHAIVYVGMESVPQDEAETESGEAAKEDTRPADGTPGTVTVYASIISVTVNIVNGETRLSEAIYNDAVRMRSAMSDAQLSNQSVMLNDQSVEQANLDTIRLHSGDVIKLTARAAHDKGAC